MGILIAFAFPECVVKLVENKEESLDMAIKRISKLKLKNCFLLKVNIVILESLLNRFKKF